MPAIPDRRLARLSEALLRLHAVEEPESLPLAIADSLAQVVPCANATFNVIRPPRLGLAVTRSRAIAVPAEEDRPLLRHLAQHPLVAHFARHPADAEVRQFSDFLDRSAYHRLDLYNEYYRRSDTQQQMGFLLEPAAPDGMLLVVANHVGHDTFSEDDRALAALLRPHFAQAWHLARRRAAWKRIVESLDDALAGRDGGTILLDGDGRALHVSPAVIAWLGECLDEPIPLATGLPDTVSRWVRRCQEPRRVGEPPAAPAPLDLEGPGYRLRLHHRPASPGLLAALLVERVRTSLPHEEASALGLTPREREVLEAIGQGRTSSEIAVLLGMSPRTAQKHTERIFQKLGVETRQAALLRVRDMLGA